MKPSTPLTNAERRSIGRTAFTMHAARWFFFSQLLLLLSSFIHDRHCVSFLSLSSGLNVCWPTGACSKLERRLSLQNGTGPRQWLEYTWSTQGKQNASREKLFSALCPFSFSISWLSWPASSLRKERKKLEPPRSLMPWAQARPIPSHRRLFLYLTFLSLLFTFILHGSVLKIKTMSRNVCDGEQYCLFPWTPTADNLRLHGLLTKSLSGVSKTQSLLARFLKTKGKQNTTLSYLLHSKQIFVQFKMADAQNKQIHEIKLTPLKNQSF